MEIEAKFAVTNDATVKKLRALERVENFALGEQKRVVMRDMFFDTRTDALHNVRYVLRVRCVRNRTPRNDGKFFLTLKTPTITQGAIHRRPEIEQEIFIARTPRVLRVNELPTKFRTLIAPVTDANLLPLFSIAQTREVRNVLRGRRVIAEWSLDFVKFRAGERRHAFYELEIELKKAGTENDLEKIAEWLQNEFQLTPVSKGKFLRAVEFMRGA